MESLLLVAAIAGFVVGTLAGVKTDGVALGFVLSFIVLFLAGVVGWFIYFLAFGIGAVLTSH